MKHPLNDFTNLLRRSVESKSDMLSSGICSRIFELLRKAGSQTRLRAHSLFSFQLSPHNIPDFDRRWHLSIKIPCDESI